jgi:branched-chain amino acid transport system substrate-binding protein
MWLRSCAVAAVIGLALVAAPAAAQKQYGPGVTDAEIKIGGTAPYSGPVSAAGALGKVESAYVAMLNEQGGINGRKITFLSLDDGYSPPKTLEQTRRLVEEEQVLLIFGSVGTPTNTAIHKYLNARKVPQLFPSSGMSALGDPAHFPWTMGFQPNYRSEGKIYATYILKAIDHPKIAILYQNDDFGKDLLAGIKAGLGDRAGALIAQEISYEVSDPAIDSEIVTLQASGADVFVNITTPKFAAQAIRKSYDIGWHPTQFLSNIAAGIATTLTPAGLEKSVGIISAQYLKDYSDPAWAQDEGMRDYVAFLQRYAPEIDPNDHFAAQGYTTVQALVQVLKQCGDDLTRENVMRQAAALHDLRLPLLLPGIVVETGPSDFYPIRQEQLVRFDGKAWVRFGEVLSGS